MRDVLVLCYHLIDPGCRDEMSVPPDRLRSQITALLARGYRPTTFSDATAHHGGEVGVERRGSTTGTPPDAGELARLRAAPEEREARVLAVTFDDAFAGTWLHAAPVLADLGVVATVFVPTALVTRGEPMRWPGLERHELTDHERLPMTWRQLGALVEQGWEVGSHTATHARLDDCSPKDLQAELRDSAVECEQRLGRPCPTLAYPFGGAGPRVRQAARDAGYQRAAVLGAGRGPWAVSRVGVYQADTAARLRLKVARPARGPSAVMAVRALRTARSAAGRLIT